MLLPFYFQSSQLLPNPTGYSKRRMKDEGGAGERGSGREDAPYFFEFFRFEIGDLRFEINRQCLPLSRSPALPLPRSPAPPSSFILFFFPATQVESAASSRAIFSEEERNRHN
jgi:hypothetical protein